MRFLWDQLAASELVIRSISNANLVSAHRERLHLHQFLMGILDDFESICNRLLNRSPLLTVNQAVNDLVREETRLKSHRSSQPHTMVLATPASIGPTVTAPPMGHDKKAIKSEEFSYYLCFLQESWSHY